VEARPPCFVDNRPSDGNSVVIGTRRLHLTSAGFLVLFSVKDRDDPRAIMRPEGLSKFEYAITSFGIDPATS
jgi:hypothetical protein